MVIHSLAGLPASIAYFLAAVALCLAYLFVYMKVTPHDEHDLIVWEHNTSAASSAGMMR